MLGARHDQVQVAVQAQAGDGGVEEILAVLVADARRGDGPVEGRAGDGKCRRGADHRRHLRIDGWIQGLDCGDNLHLTAEAVGEQRPDRAVNEARGKDLVLARAPLAAEEAAWDAARGISFLLIVDSQWQEILDLGSALVDYHGHQDDGVVDINQDSAIRLAGDLARLQGHGLGAKLEGLFDMSHLEFLGARAGRGDVPTFRGPDALAGILPARFGMGRGAIHGVDPGYRVSIGQGSPPCRGKPEDRVTPVWGLGSGTRISDADPGGQSARDSGRCPCP